MRRAILLLTILLPMVAGQSCLDLWFPFIVLPVETRFSFINFSTQYYAVLGIREHSRTGEAGDFSYTPLLAPGATTRADFRVSVESGCPDSIDLRLLLYRRVHTDVPIGLDETEEVESAPIVAGEVLDVPACRVQVLETYTIVNWEAPEGVGRVKLAQCSRLDEVLSESGMFDNDLDVWEISGVDPTMAEISPPALADIEPITGRVVLADGSGLGGVGVMIRSAYRVRLDCDNPRNEQDTGYSEPIAFAVTDETGAFQIDRPAGVYQLELFSDEYAFRPAMLAVETPLRPLTIVAEPVE